MDFKRIRFILDRLKDNFNNVSLKQKLLICYGTLIVISVVFIGTFSYYIMEKYIFEQTGKSLSQTLIQQKINIEDRLNTYDALMKQTATDNNLIFALSTQYSSPADYSYEYLNTISKVLEMQDKDNNIVGLYIFNNNETLPENGVNLIDMDKAGSKAWFEKYFDHYDRFSISDFINLDKSKIWFVTNEKVKTTNIAVPDTKNGLKIAVIKPVVFYYEKLVGILELFLDYDSVFGEFKSEDKSSNDRIFISDENNEIIFDSFGDTRVKSKLNDTYSRQLDGKNEGSFQPDQSKKLVLFTKGEKSRWTYFREVPLESLFSSAKAVREVTVTITIVSVVISFIIGIAIASILSRRIGALLNKMEQVKDLSLDVYVNIGGKDEIGNLARGYNQMIDKIKDLIEQLKTSQLIYKEAEMKALQAQINPHFLYNTLATISWMAMGKNTDKIVTMVDSLSVFYRMSLNKGRSFIRICDEITQVKAYTHIQKVRLENKINVIYDVQEEICGYYSPKLIIQPFVENAILHGSDCKDGTTNIIVKGYSSQNNVIFEIIDDGIGMKNVPEPDKYVSTGGYGIRNVHEKIQLQFGCSYGVRIFSGVGLGTKVSVTIPLITENPEKGIE
jgi:Predicted signal transduction protein with a C-terminal ATPase domain